MGCAGSAGHDLALKHKLFVGDSLLFTLWRARGFPSALIREARLNKSFKQRMRLVRFALEFGVILAADKVGMIAKLD